MFFSKGIDNKESVTGSSGYTILFLFLCEKCLRDSATNCKKKKIYHKHERHDLTLFQSRFNNNHIYL
jgi:hypothetical protein